MYRRPLSKDQLHTLKIIYKFRFVSSGSLAVNEGTYKSVIYSRLKILYDQGYIAKNYDKSYRLPGKSAAYYLLPKALKLLKTDPYHHPRVLRNMYRDHTVSQQFMEHCLNCLDIYVKFKQVFGLSLSARYFSKSELAPFEYFPNPRPDAYFELNRGGQTKLFMLDSIEEAMPWFVVKRRIQLYMDHVDNGDWDDSGTDNYPVVLLVCESDKLYKRLKRHIHRTLEEIWAEGLLFGLTTKEALLSSGSKTDKIWLPVSDEIETRTSLGKLSVQSR